MTPTAPPFSMFGSIVCQDYDYNATRFLCVWVSLRAIFSSSGLCTTDIRVGNLVQRKEGDFPTAQQPAGKCRDCIAVARYPLSLLWLDRVCRQARRL